MAEFGWTKEIEDRLLAPMPTSLVATLIMIPVGILILGSIPWRWAGFPLFVAGLVLGALVGAGFGLLLGTQVQPQRIKPALLARLHAAAVYGLQPVPVAVALEPALVPGRHRRQPDRMARILSPRNRLNRLSAQRTASLR